MKNKILIILIMAMSMLCIFSTIVSAAAGFNRTITLPRVSIKEDGHEPVGSLESEIPTDEDIPFIKPSFYSKNNNNTPKTKYYKDIINKTSFEEIL